MFNVDAAKVIHSIVQFSPHKESVALEFLNKVQEASRLRHLGRVPLLPEYSPLT
jgi:hypothetical protein